MNKVKILEVKKLLKELEFIESDFDYRNEIISEADTIFINSINQFLEEHSELKEIYDNKITEKINESIKKNEESDKEKIIFDITDDTEDETNQFDDSEEDEEKNKDKEHFSAIKKLYREIVKLTHPDKIKNKRLNDLYVKATQFYDSENKIGIYGICSELNIQYDFSENDVSLINEQIQKIQQKITFIESTYTWQWYNCEDEILKNQILINYIKLKIS